MDTEACISMCRSLAMATSAGVRLYDHGDLVFYYSISNLHPDPLEPYLGQILDSDQKAGIITTPLYQFYGFLAFQDSRHIILGPSRMLQEDSKETELLLALLHIRQDDRDNYHTLLRTAPIISVDRFVWLLACLMSLLQESPFPTERVWLQIRPESNQAAVRAEYAQRHLDSISDADMQQPVAQSYAWEQLVLSYIENGRPEPLRKLFAAPPNITVGRMAHDGLRQIKNIGICTATSASRAAIRGGLDPQKAFSMSDLYIQKLELMRDLSTIERLNQEMILDFAEQVKKLRQFGDENSPFYRMCARYVSENLFTTIRVEQMANALGYTRSYLCTRFKKEAGISLTQFIQREKIEEAKQLLQFTDQGLGQIAALLDFSSQSHFQTVFRKITGDTPMAYRRRTKFIGSAAK